jgi:hypothetical protein
MEQQILDVIRAAIPENEMGIVKLVFQERDTFKSELEKSQEHVLQLTKQLTEANGFLSQVRAREQENITKQTELATKESDIKVRETKLEISLAQKETSVIRECFDKIMKVPMIRKNIYKSVPVANNGYVSTQTQNENEETHEE